MKITAARLSACIKVEVPTLFIAKDVHNDKACSQAALPPFIIPSNLIMSSIVSRVADGRQRVSCHVVPRLPEVAKFESVQASLALQRPAYILVSWFRLRLQN